MKRLTNNFAPLHAPEAILMTWNAKEEYVRKVLLEKINIFGAGKI